MHLRLGQRTPVWTRNDEAIAPAPAGCGFLGLLLVLAGTLVGFALLTRRLRSLAVSMETFRRRHLSPEGETFRWVTDARAITDTTPEDSDVGVPVAAELEAQVAAYAEVGVYGDGGAPSTEGRFDPDLVAGLYDDAGTVIWPG